MLWRFTILDRNNVATVIDEQPGWDANTCEIKRDPDWHGIFFNTQEESLEFNDDAYRMLKAEYEEHGSQGDMTLIMEEDCGNGYEEFERGKFNFNKYDAFAGDDTFVKITLEKSGETMELRNRINQKVNLEAVKAFDGVTDLPVYPKLSFDLQLPSKGIFLQNRFLQDNDFTTPVLGVPFNNHAGAGLDPLAWLNGEHGIIELGFDNQKLTEIGNAGAENQLRYNCILTDDGDFGCDSINKFVLPGYLSPYIAPLDITALVNLQQGTPNYDSISSKVSLDIQVKGSITSLNCEFNGVYFVLASLPLGKDGVDGNSYVYHDVHTYQAGAYTPLGTTISLNYNYLNANFSLNKGDMLYAFVFVYHRRENRYAGTDAFTMSMLQDSHFIMETLSHTPATKSKVFAVNETLSRVAEVITNNKLRVYSNHFGRTDSMPYSQAYDGCGALEVVTDGLRIRGQENKIAGQTNLFSLSLQDVFEGLNPIHNIGMGIEKDTNRAGYNRLRVEPWTHFYKPEVMMYCTGVNKIERRVYEKDIYSTFQFGYSKWEAEEFNGLDEFLTKRTYRTTLSQVKNDLVKLSRFVASGYAIEVTRRKGSADSKDWRYDKETFIICCKRGGLSYSTPAAFFASSNSFNIITDNPSFFEAGDVYSIANTASNNANFTIDHITPIGNSLQIFLTGNAVVTENAAAPVFTNITPNKLSVELGNVTNPENIIDSDTLYNYRISPLRNAMRWMNHVLESYRKFDGDAKLLFTDGDANYFAKGEMTDVYCRQEAGALAENDTIDITIYNDSDNAKPILFAERVLYEYPMNSKEYKRINEDPYRLIYFENDCDEGYGYIDTIKYTPEEGLASFNLIPAIVDASTLRRTIITEDGYDIHTEDGKYWEPE